MLLPRDPRHSTVNFNLGGEGEKPAGLRLHALGDPIALR